MIQSSIEMRVQIVLFLATMVKLKVVLKLSAYMWVKCDPVRIIIFFFLIWGCCISPIWSSCTSWAPNNSQYAHLVVTWRKNVSPSELLCYGFTSHLTTSDTRGICKIGIWKVRMSDSTFYLSQNPKKSYWLFLKHCRMFDRQGGT